MYSGEAHRNTNEPQGIGLTLELKYVSLAVDPAEGKEVSQEKATTATAQSTGGTGENPQAAGEAGSTRRATGQHQPICNGQKIQVPALGNLAPCHEVATSSTLNGFHL